VLGLLLGEFAYQLLLLVILEIVAVYLFQLEQLLLALLVLFKFQQGQQQVGMLVVTLHSK
jgi:hypothetical protein